MPRACLVFLAVLGSGAAFPAETLEDDSQSTPLDRVTGNSGEVRTLDQIKKSGYLRILTRNNATSFFVYRGHRMGFDYELGKRLAQSLGIRAQFVVPREWADLIPALLRGEGDVVAGELTVTPDRAVKVRFAAPYLSTSERAVCGRKVPPISAPEDLSGKAVIARRSSAYWQTMTALNARLQAAGKPPARLVEANEDMETEDLLERVARGDVTCTLADELIANAALGAHPELVVGAAIGEKRNLAWAVRPGSADLAAAIDAMFKAEKKGPEFNILKRKYFEAPRQFAAHVEAMKTTDGMLTPYDPLIRTAAARYDFDWRLVAAQVYQESQFDPQRKSWCGAQGLFQIMPATAKELGLTDPFNPKESIDGGARYMSKLLKQFEDVPDTVERYKFALAAYNCGAGHVHDARAIVRASNADASLWERVRPAMLSLASEKVHGATHYGYCRCTEPVAYVQKITERFDAYRQLVPDTARGGATNR